MQQLARLAEAGERARQESGRAIGRTAQSAYGQGPKHDKQDPRPSSAERTPAGAPATKEARGRLRLPGLKGASLRSRADITSRPAALREQSPRRRDDDAPLTPPLPSPGGQSEKRSFFGQDKGKGTMTYTTYVIRNDAGAIYVGSTADLNARMRKHNNGNGSAFTKERGGPWTVIRTQPAPTRAGARLVEHRWHEEYLRAGHKNLGPDAVMSSAKARRVEKETGA